MSDYNKSISDYLKGDDKKIHDYIIKKSRYCSKKTNKKKRCI